MISCHFVIDLPYRFRLDLTVPGNEIVVSRETPDHVIAGEVISTVRDDFDAADWLLEMLRGRYAY